MLGLGLGFVIELWSWLGFWLCCFMFRFRVPRIPGERMGICSCWAWGVGLGESLGSPGIAEASRSQCMNTDSASGANGGATLPG